MEKSSKSNLLLILIIVFLFGCRGQKEEFLASSVSPAIEEEMPSESSTLRSEKEFLTLSEADKSIIKNYCNDLKTLAFESSAMTAKALNYDSYKEVPVEEILRNPMVAHLQFLDIKEEETNNPIHFYDLSLEDREEFLNAYLKEEQKSIEEKVALVPELLTEIEKYDLACEKIFSSQNIERLDYENMNFRKFSIAKTQSSKTLKRHPISTKEVDLFDLIEEELGSQNNIQDQGHIDMSEGLGPAMLRSSSSSGGGRNPFVRSRIISKHLEAGYAKGIS